MDSRAILALTPVVLTLALAYELWHDPQPHKPGRECVLCLTRSERLERENEQ